MLDSKMSFIKNDHINRKQNSSNKVVTMMAYLLGAREDIISAYYDADVIDKLAATLAAQIVRALSIVRMSLLRNYKEVDRELKYNMNNLDRQKYFAPDILAMLYENGVPLLKANYTADAYVGHVTELMCKYIDECKPLFPSCIEFSYIRKLFITKCYSEPNVRKRELAKYHTKNNLYPYRLYLSWEPKECGNILLNDEKFLSILYQENKDKFNQAYLFKDISAIAKEAINDFITEAKKVIFVVDCENIDPYKFFGMISSLPPKVCNRIGEIILYDDVNADVAWDSFPKCFSIPVRHENTVRILERKSVVDTELMLGVMKRCYEHSTDSVVLCSSDSDFVPLMKTLKEVNFMVLYEEDKCSNVTKGKWKSSRIPFYALDNFYQADCDELQKYVFIDALKKLLPKYIGRQVEELMKALSCETRFVLTEKQMKKYYDAYVKNIRLSVDEGGILVVSVG